MYTIYFMLYLIEILHQTTTANVYNLLYIPLYLIEILHQTTTCSYQLRKWTSCILSKFYIKPQPRNDQPAFTQRCILSKFYIKPQHRERRGYADRVVSYRNSTSNHNSRSVLPIKPPVVSYRNSTSNHNRGFCHRADHEVVSYRNSTSNHNIVHTMGRNTALYLIEILHQTTTKVFFIYLWCKNSTSYHNKAICRRFSTYCLRVLRGDFFYIS